MVKQTQEAIAKNNNNARGKKMKSRTWLFENRSVSGRAGARIAKKLQIQASRNRLSGQEKKWRNEQDTEQKHSSREKEKETNGSSMSNQMKTTSCHKYFFLLNRQWDIFTAQRTLAKGSHSKPIFVSAANNLFHLLIPQITMKEMQVKIRRQRV